MFLIIEKSEETTFIFLQNSVTLLWLVQLGTLYKLETQKMVNLLNDTNIYQTMNLQILQH